jgi:hypothetical protein
MKVSTENDNNFGYEKNTIVVDNISLINCNEIFSHGLLYFVQISLTNLIRLQFAIFNG